MIKQFARPEIKDRLVYTYEWTPKYQPGEIVVYEGQGMEGVDQITDVGLIIDITRKPTILYKLRGKVEIFEDMIQHRLVEALDDDRTNNDMAGTIASINN